MNRFILPGCVIGLTLLTPARAELEPASVASLSPTDLIEYESQPPAVQQLIEEALSLTKKGLTYQFGSNSPENPGMDCSGTVQFTLKEAGVNQVPRSSYTMFKWAEEEGMLVDTRGVTTTEDPVFDPIQPGDLLFWEGTYDTGDRDPPISHVMLYLGRLKEDGRGVVFGASDGRRFRGKRIHGVSVFDWRVPPEGSSSKFVAFGPVPGLVGEEGRPPRSGVEAEISVGSPSENAGEMAGGEASEAPTATAEARPSGGSQKKPFKPLRFLEKVFR
ncbi:MAG: NlpC/P60 family protein [Verrucomicrobiota bacterium]